MSFDDIEIELGSGSVNGRDASDEVHDPAPGTYKITCFDKNTVSMRTRGVSHDSPV